MPNQYMKTRKCGCVVRAISVGSEMGPNGKCIYLGGHIHLTICNNCKQKEDNVEDTLYDLWMSDNVTDEKGYAGWTSYSGVKEGQIVCHSV